MPQFEEVKINKLPLQVSGEGGGTTNTTGRAQEATSAGALVSPASPFTGAPLQSTKPRVRTRGKPSRDPRDIRTVFVGNIPCTSTRKQIRQLFKKYGKVETVRVRCLQVKEGKLPRKVAMRTHKQITEESTFNAYVVFSSEEEAEKSLKLNGTLLNGRHLRVDLVSKKDAVRKLKESQVTVFVGNLPFTADEEKLRTCFGSCGDVESVRIVRDAKTGIGKGFGFVSFSDKSGVMFAVRQNRRIEMDGRKLRVFKSKDEQTLKLQKQAKFSGMRAEQETGKKGTRKYPRSDRDGGKTGGTPLKKKGATVRARGKSNSTVSLQRKTISKRSGVSKKT